MANVTAKKKPNDYVIATGKVYSVKDFVEKHLNLLMLKLNGMDQV